MGQVIVVSAASASFDSGNQAKITINDNVVEMGKNENGSTRGLHIVIINPLDGSVELCNIFDTYKTS